jgi:diguanylate cyclase (GGDEF)-like protein
MHMSGSRSQFRSDDESGRQCALDRLQVLDSEREPEFENITKLVQAVFDVPIAAVSLIDRRRQWFKSIQGIDASEMPREVAFCDHTIRATECLQVPDTTLDIRFCTNPVVTGPPYIRSYLGAPLITPDGYALGALCAIDFKPRQFSPAQELVLTSFSELVMSEFELRQVAAIDVLTGLATRRAFIEKIKELVRKGSKASLIYVDLDRFKTINDTYGHPTGDDVLQAAAGAIMESCDARAYVGRLGGEELAIVLPGADDADAMDAAEHIRGAIERARIVRFPDLIFTASLGVASRLTGMDHLAWLAAADAALYDAKNSGRNCVRCSVPALSGV